MNVDKIVVISYGYSVRNLRPKRVGATVGHNKKAGRGGTQKKIKILRLVQSIKMLQQFKILAF